MNKPQDRSPFLTDRALIIYVMLAGAFLRLCFFPQIPPGLNQDEASAGYEAYSLLMTGKDRWGNSWPVYFPSWGSGQNVLYSYLTIPLVGLFGLNIFSTRLVNLIFGLLALPLFYWTTKQACNQKIAFASTLILAIFPWHMMLSRWGLESNLLPFFLLLGIDGTQRGLDKTIPSRFYPLIWLPFGLSLYAYAISIFVIPTLLLLIIGCHYRQILNHRKRWLAAIVGFVLTTFPLLLFFLKAKTGKNLGWEDFLPFSIPLLPSQRFSQIGQDTSATISENLKFLITGFNDGLDWNRLPDSVPLFPSLLLFPLLTLGLITLILNVLKEQDKGRKNLFLFWFISCLPLWVIAPLNINRANAMFMPMIVISMVGFDQLQEWLRAWMRNHGWQKQKWIRLFIASIVLVMGLQFTSSYFLSYPDLLGLQFQVGFQEALELATEMANPPTKVLVTQNIPLPYIYVLFFQKISPKYFQTEAKVSIVNGIYQVHRLNQFYFDSTTLKADKIQSFTFVLRQNEPDVCTDPLLYYKDTHWKVGRCSTV